MPTAAKLIAAVLVAAVAYIASEWLERVVPTGVDLTAFKGVNTGLGAIVGWRVLGRRAGAGYARAASSGVMAVIVLVVLGLLGYGAREMLIRATERRYEDPMEAILAMVAIAVDYARMMLDGPLIAILLLGGLAAGLGTEAASRRWR